MTLNDLNQYISKNRNVLSLVNGQCVICPIKLKCDKAFHNERKQGILCANAANTRYPKLTNFFQNSPWILDMIPRGVFRIWGEYKKNPLGCPTVGISEHMEDIVKTYSLLDDELSRKTYLNVLMYRLTCDWNYLSHIVPEADEYFEVFNGLDVDECVIDVGAYVGDTLESYLTTNCVPYSYYAFEPDPINFQNLIDYIKAIDAEKYVFPVNYAVGECTSNLKMDIGKKAASHSSNEGTYECKMISLDEYMRTTRDFERVSFIKMDIEGLEERALIGAQELIISNKPKLAVCVYHKSEDIWKIPLQIKKMNPEYEHFILRHYHKYSFTETILYVY